MIVSSGQVYSSGFVLSSDVIMQVSSGGLVDGILVDGGHLTVYDGGSAVNTVVNNSGSINFSGGTVSNTTLNLYGALTVRNGMIANRTTINSRGQLAVLSGTANDVTVNSVGRLLIYHDGKANDIRLRNGGRMDIAINGSGGGSADNIEVNSGASLYVSSGGKATRVRENGGFVEIQAGANVSFASSLLNALTVSSGGRMTVHSNTSAVNTTVNGHGTLIAFKGGVVSNTAVNSDGTLTVTSGASVGGAMTFLPGSIISAEAGGIFDFTVAGRTTRDDYLINDLSLITGSPSFTITVTADLALGTYKLAQGAASFNGTVSIGTATERFGSLTVNSGSVTAGMRVYYLRKSSGDLTLLVEKKPDTTPPVIRVSPNTTAPTNQPVILTATASDDFAVASLEYSLDGSDWNTYLNPIIIASNQTVYFRATDTSSNVAQIAYVVKNIDLTPPDAPTAWSDVTSATDSPVAVRASFSSDTVTKQYSWDRKTWQNDTTPILFGANNTVYFRGRDAAGNDSVITSHTVDNITVKPISDGGTVSGKKYIYAGGTATSNTVNSGGILVVREGGRASVNTVNSGGRIYLSGGLANDTTVNKGGLIQIYSGGAALRGKLNAGGYVHVFNAGSARSMTVLSDGRIYVSSGGSSIDNRGNSGALILISSGGFSLRDLILQGANEHLYAGASGSAINVSNGGILRVSSGATASRSVIRSDGNLHIFAGGSTSNSLIILGGREYVRTGGSAVTTVISSGGLQLVSSGGFTRSAHIRTGGQLHLYAGARATETNVSSGGQLRVSSGAAALGTILRTAGSEFVYDSGIASATTIVANGRLNVLSGGRTVNTRVSAGGMLVASSGALVTGSLNITAGATVRLDSGSRLNFNITAEAPGSTALVSNFSVIKGTPDYTISAEALQTVGVYTLATGVNSFTGSITVKAGSSTLKGLTVGGQVEGSGRRFALSLSGTTLKLNVTAVESGVEELMQSALQESCMPVISSSGFSSEVGGLIPDCGELSVCTDTLLEFGSSTRTAGGMLAG